MRQLMGNTASLSEGSDVYYRFSINNIVCNKCDNANYFTFSIDMKVMMVV